MAYCDYSFYVNEYLGNVIAEEDFPRLAERASERLDVLTFGRLENGLSDDEKVATKVKKAVCAMAESLNDIEIANRTIRQNGGSAVASISSGSESISYRAEISETEQNRALMSVASTYLHGTGLLYAGL